MFMTVKKIICIISKCVNILYKCYVYLYFENHQLDLIFYEINAVFNTHIQTGLVINYREFFV